jgi:SET domain-containing protein
MSRIAVGHSTECGRGVYALQHISEGELVETCETLSTEFESDLDAWIYEALEDGYGLIALGLGSLYNHSLEPNAHYEVCEDDKIRIWALKHIGPGSEIRFNYNGDPEDQTEWVFE